jgi:hypothetical protein
MSERVRLMLLMVLATALLLSAGCSTWNIRKVWPWNDDDKPQSPVKMVAIWTDTVKFSHSEPAQRGFGGRLMFYATAEGAPVKVEGDLVVYAFDEAHRKASDTRPDRKFVFTAEQLSHHYSKSKLGHSYSLWIPWGDALGPQTKISLIVRFLPKEKEGTAGGVLVSEQSTQVLPGSNPEPNPANPIKPATGSPESDQTVRTVSQEVPVPSPPPRPVVSATVLPGLSSTSEPPDATGHVRTTTIYVPPSSNLNQPGMQASVAMLGPNMSGVGSLPNPMPAANPASACPAVPPGFYPAAAYPMNQASSSPAAGAQPNSSLPGTTPPNFFSWQPRNSIATHFEHPRFPAPAEATAPPATDRAPTTPLPGGSPFGPGPQPQLPTGP